MRISKSHNADTQVEHFFLVVLLHSVTYFSKKYFNDNNARSQLQFCVEFKCILTISLSSSGLYQRSVNVSQKRSKLITQKLQLQPLIGISLHPIDALAKRSSDTKSTCAYCYEKTRNEEKNVVCDIGKE